MHLLPKFHLVFLFSLFLCVVRMKISWLEQRNGWKWELEVTITNKQKPFFASSPSSLHSIHCFDSVSIVWNCVNLEIGSVSFQGTRKSLNFNTKHLVLHFDCLIIRNCYLFSDHCVQKMKKQKTREKTAATNDRCLDVEGKMFVKRFKQI